MIEIRDAFFVAFFALMMFAAGVRAAEPMLPMIKWNLPPMDGVKHGATKEVFDRLVGDYKKRSYKIQSDAMNGQCVDLLTALRDGRATWVEPKINTDDYNDPRFEPHKKKYKEAISKSKEEWAKVPGANWFGGVISSRYQALERPTRNFALYEVDIDGDNNNEIIFYGEFRVGDPAGMPGSAGPSTFINLAGTATYILYKDYAANNIVSTPDEYDFEKKRHSETYSGLFQFGQKKFVVTASLGDDFTLTKIYEIGWFDGLNNRKVPFQTRCEFSVE